jgi:hypothetical protein
MFRLRLHPSRFGLFSGLAVIAFWALLWLWFFGQLSPSGTGQGPDSAPAQVARSLEPSQRPHAAGAGAPAGAF